MKLNRQAGCNRNAAHDLRKALESYKNGERYRLPELSTEEREMRVERMAELVDQNRLPTTGEDLPDDVSWDSPVDCENLASEAGEYHDGYRQPARSIVGQHHKRKRQTVKRSRKVAKPRFLSIIRQNRKTLAKRMQAARRHFGNDAARSLRASWERFDYGCALPVHRLTIVAILKIAVELRRYHPYRAQIVLRAARAMAVHKKD